MVAEKKYIFVYGAGISGQGVAEVLARHGKKVILYNDEPREVDPMVEQILVKTGGKVVMKEDPTPYLKASWYAIISPGIPFTTATPPAVSPRMNSRPLPPTPSPSEGRP